MIEITYNTKSPFANQYSSGSRRFESADMLADWLAGQLVDTGWPVIITSIKAVK